MNLTFRRSFVRMVLPVNGVALVERSSGIYKPNAVTQAYAPFIMALARRLAVFLLAVVSVGQAQTIGRLDGSASAPLHGRPLAAGSPANIVLYDPAARSVVDPVQHASRSRNTPFAGLDLPGQVVATFLRGEPTVLDGKLAR